MNDLVLDTAAFLVAAASLPGSLTLGALSLTALWPGRRTDDREAAETRRIAIAVPAHNETDCIGHTLDSLLPAARANGSTDVWVIADNRDDGTATRAEAAETGRIAIVVPAHNEADGIGHTLDSLLPAARADGSTDVWVIADNCDDDTAERAEAAGARVIIRRNAQLRGKGHALEYAFSRLTPMGYAWLLVIDADSTLEPGFLLAMRASMHSSRNALQACYLSQAGSRMRSRVSRLAQWGFNLVRPLARERLGFSCGLLGNGFALRASLLERLPYRAYSVVEDLEYHLLLVNAGERVHFVADARVTGEIADTREGARTQRTRWEGGRLRMLREHLGPLLKRTLTGDRAAAELLADLLLLPLGMHVLLLLAAALLGSVGTYAALIGVFAIGLYVAAILWRGPTTAQDLGALAFSPFYLAWKLTLLPATLLHSRRRARWVRSRRNASGVRNG